MPKKIPSEKWDLSKDDMQLHSYTWDQAIPSSFPQRPYGGLIPTLRVSSIQGHAIFIF